MAKRRISLEIEVSGGEKLQSQADIDVGNTTEKQKHVGLSSEASRTIVIDDITFSFKPGSDSTTGILLGTLSGTLVIDGFHWCMYGTASLSNYLIDNVTLSATPKAIPDTGITEAHEWRKMWFWVKGVENTMIYHVEAFKRGTKLLMQVWKE